MQDQTCAPLSATQETGRGLTGNPVGRSLAHPPPITQAPAARPGHAVMATGGDGDRPAPPTIRPSLVGADPA